MKINHFICQGLSLCGSEIQDNKTNLLEKFFVPVVKGIEGPHHIHIIYQNTAICTSIKCNSKTLKSLLASSVPNLPESSKQLNHWSFNSCSCKFKTKTLLQTETTTHLKSDEPIIYLKFLGDEICANCSFVLLTKFLVNISNSSVKEST